MRASGGRPRTDRFVVDLSGKQFGKAYLRGCARTLVVSVVGGIFGVILVAFCLYLAKDARPEDELRIWLILGAFQLVMMLAMVGVAVLIVKWRGRKLDRGFAGATGKQVMTTVRTWSGEVDGRPFNAWVAKGPRLELYLETNVGTRGAIRRVGPVIRAFGNLIDSTIKPIEPPAALADCEVLCRDGDWMRRLVRRPGVARVLAELMEPSERILPGVSFRPKSVGYIRQFIPLSEVTEERIDHWIGKLSEIADAVEATGPSSERLEPSKLETWARTSRKLPVHPILIGLGCGFVAVGVIVVVVLGVVAVVTR